MYVICTIQVVVVFSSIFTVLIVEIFTMPADLYTIYETEAYNFRLDLIRR